MGRIADALRRAERERRESLAMPSVDGVKPAVDTSAPRTQALAMTLTGPAPEEKKEERQVELVEGLPESLVPFYEHSSLVTEQYRSLRTRLLSQNPQYEHRVIAITSAVPKEGKSVTTLNLGCVLAEIRHLKVLVVDGDFRRSSLADMLHQPPGPGLAEVLRREADYHDVLQDTAIPNLKFLPAGSTKKRSAAELLTEASARPAFRQMQNDFHYTIVDTPPATTVTDVGIIGQMCSGVIVIVRLHRTYEAAAKRAVRLLQVNNVHIIGCMLVGRDAPVGQYGYGHGYRHNYYRYYDYYKKPESKKG